MERGREEKLEQETTFEQMLDRWYRDILTLELQHIKASAHLKKRSQALGIPVIVLSTVIGTAAFTSLSEEVVHPAFKVLLGTLGVLSAVLIALQTNLNLAEKAAQHKVAADGFEVLKDELEAIGISRDEAQLAEFCKSSYPSRKQALLEGTDVISEDIRKEVENEVTERMETRQADREHREALDRFIERDRVYDDVDTILHKIEREEAGREFVFRMRKELNRLHLGREPVVTIEKVKEMLHQLRLYTKAKAEDETFDDSITPAFVEAVMDFQGRYSLEQVDGIVGPHTKQMLKEATGQAK